MPAPAPRPAGGPHSQALRAQFERVRGRARRVALGGALLAALAADIWYDVLAFAAWRFARADIYVPLFFAVALAVFAAFALRRTGVRSLSAVLDRTFALKERLVSALRFARHPGVPAELREAQALETLRAVDFSRLRASFRFRPRGALAFLAAGAAATAWLMHTYPAAYNPHSLVFRQGRVVFMKVKRLGAGRVPTAAETAPAGGEWGSEGSHPRVELVPEEQPRGKGAGTGAPAPAGGGDSPGEVQQHGAETAQEKRPESRPERADGERDPANGGKGEGTGGGKGAAGGAGDAAGRERPLSIEETAAVSPLTQRPAGAASAAPDLRGSGTGPALPPLPFIRLLGGGAPEAALFDPETLNVVLEAYPRKYRAHLEAYLKALQSLLGGRAGA